MNRTQWHRLILLSTSILTVMPVKCNSILAKRNPHADDGYEYVMVTGHLTPQRVKKGQAPAADSNQVEVLGGDALRNYSQKNQTKGPKLGGG
jgi:hypothetical protein